MPYVYPEVDDLDGHDLVGAFQCVALVQAVAGAPRTSDWRQGIPVRGELLLAKGTAIATFEDGVYKSRPHGNHAALYLRQDQGGIWVMDQWANSTKLEVSRHCLQFKGVAKDGSWIDASSNGDAFSVIERPRIDSSPRCSPPSLRWARHASPPRRKRSPVRHCLPAARCTSLQPTTAGRRSPAPSRPILWAGGPVPRPASRTGRAPGVRLRKRLGKLEAGRCLSRRPAGPVRLWRRRVDADQEAVDGHGYLHRAPREHTADQAETGLVRLPLKTPACRAWHSPSGARVWAGTPDRRSGRARSP